MRVPLASAVRSSFSPPPFLRLVFDMSQDVDAFETMRLRIKRMIERAFDLEETGPRPMDFRDLENRFTYYAPSSDQVSKYDQIRGAALRFATLLNELTPDSREKSLAITHLEETVMWANASIARNES